MMDDSDCMVECPYNKSHRVQKSRMQTHLFKCRKNYPSVELRRCPFNANHDIVPAEFPHHMETCPDRGSVQTHLAQTAKERTPVIMPYVAPILPSEGEDWDCDVPVQTYDPTAKNMNVKVLRGLQGASKSERKNHRAKERLRFNAVAENGGLEGAVGGCIDNNNFHPAEEAKSKHAYNYDQEVRQPKSTPKTFAVVAPATPKKTLANAPLKSDQAQDWSLPFEDMPAAKSSDKNPAILTLWSNGTANGLPAAGNAKTRSPEKKSEIQASQQAASAWVKPPVQLLPATSYKVVVNVDTGVGVPAPNLERDFPALGRGRGRLRDNSN